MKALRFHSFGGPEVLTLEELPRPTPGPGELLVEVYAAAVNPSDAKNVQGSMSQTKPPRTPGRDFAGLVVGGPDGWRGARVFGTSGQLGFTRDGTHAELVVVPEECVARMPSGLSWAEAAAIGVPYVTAWEGIVNRAALKAGETVLVIGGTGSVGTAATQIARWRGARVLATARRAVPANDEWRRNVDAIVDLEHDSITGVDVVLDAAGGETFSAGMRTLARGGRLVVITAAPDSPVRLDLRDFYRRDLTLLGVNSLKLPDARSAQILGQFAPGFESGALKIRPPRTLPLEEARTAYAEVLKGSASKIVLITGDGSHG